MAEGSSAAGKTPRGVSAATVSAPGKKARCEGGSELEERAVWPSEEDLPVGVFTVKNQELDIPVMNTTEKPMILKEGEELGQWGTEKWKSKWEEMNPLMMDKEIPHLDREEHPVCTAEGRVQGKATG
ncbi:unnamed protein product [Cylicocyclus nassatus]|uniref:Uncharacterized protein n=1 Tax=Cylicocyclus nassatus TaxID=53992 RepID=A0AA36GTV7_CYLNA|nr:unnamed protein product [Cylicocyclus nassatus]